MELYVIDLIIIVIILLSCGQGVLRGLVDEILNLSHLLLSLAIAYFISPFLAVWLEQYVFFAAVSHILAFLILLVASMFLLDFAIAPMRNRMRRNIGMISRLLGLLFGMIRGYVIIIIFVLVYLTLKSPSDPAGFADSSYLFFIFESGGRLLHGYIDNFTFWQLVPSFLQ